MKKVIITNGLLLVGVGMFLGACSKPIESKTEQKFELSPKMLASTTFEVAKMEPLKNELSFYGKIVADNNKTVEVYPIVGGNVTRVLVELGDYVHKGDLLATIRSTEVASFETELIGAKNDLLVAKNNLKVTQEMYDGKLAVEREVTQAKSEVEKAKAQLDRIQQTFRIYNIKPGAIYEVRAPMSGFIIEKKINEGMLLRNDKSDNIFDIAEINDVWALANVNESDIGDIQLGVQAKVAVLSYQDTWFSGSVDKIFNVIDPETQAMRIRIKLANKEYKLKPEMRAKVVLAFDEKEQMITVPKSAIIFDNNVHYVMVYHSKNRIETRVVEVFREVGNSAYIKSGVQQGERIITKNQLLIYDALND